MSTRCSCEAGQRSQREIGGSSSIVTTLGRGEDGEMRGTAGGKRVLGPNGP